MGDYTVRILQCVAAALSFLLLVDWIQLAMWQANSINETSSTVTYVIWPAIQTLLTVYVGILIGFAYSVWGRGYLSGLFIVAFLLFEFILCAIGNEGKTISGRIFYAIVG